MNLNALSTETMLTHSERWLADATVRAVLMAYPMGQALEPEIRTAHDLMATTFAGRRQIARAVADLTQQLGHTDGRFDNGARGLYYGLSALIAWLPNRDLAVRLSELRARMFTDGLAIVNRSYLDEAGYVLALEGDMQPVDVQLLDSLSLGTYTLGDIYRSWLTHGAQLRQLSQERSRLQAIATEDGSARPGIDRKVARNKWIRMVHAIQAAFALIELSDDDRDLLFGPLEQSVLQAVRASEEDAGEGVETEPETEPEGEGEGEGEGEPEGEGEGEPTE